MRREQLLNNYFYPQHYVLVHPEYHGKGIAGHMIRMIEEKYKNYLYIEVMPPNL